MVPPDIAEVSLQDIYYYTDAHDESQQLSELSLQLEEARTDETSKPARKTKPKKVPKPVVDNEPTKQIRRDFKTRRTYFLVRRLFHRITPRARRSFVTEAQSSNEKCQLLARVDFERLVRERVSVQAAWVGRPQFG